MADVAVDPPAASSTCDGCVKAEAQIRLLLGLISNSMLNNPSKFFGFELPTSEPVDSSELFDRWVKDFDSDPRFPLCPHLKKRIQALVRELLDARVACSDRSRKRKAPPAADSGEGLTDMLASLRLLAVDPGAGADRYWRRKVLNVRKAMFLRMANGADFQQFPYLHKHKRHKFLSGMNSNPVRRSQRTLLKIGNGELPRKHIPVGPSFQADVPEWTGPPKKEDASDDHAENSSKWLGTQIWPTEGDDRQINKKRIGRGKTSLCNCSSRGSTECVRFHVNQARQHLKSYLGPSFFSLGFSEMGEEVSESWTQDDQMRFDDIVRENCAESKSFWEPLLECFTYKSRKDIVSFYFNVFLLRWMSVWTRQRTQPVYSSDDENAGW